MTESALGHAAPNQLTRCRQAIIDRLNDHPELKALGLVAYRHIPDGGVDLPAAVVELTSTTSMGTRNDNLEVVWSLIVLTNAAESEVGQEQLDSFLVGPASIRRALEGTNRDDRTLDGTCSDMVVTESNSRGKLPLGEGEGWAHEWTIQCLMKEGELHG